MWLAVLGLALCPVSRILSDPAGRAWLSLGPWWGLDGQTHSCSGLWSGFQTEKVPLLTVKSKAT